MKLSTRFNCRTVPKSAAFIFTFMLALPLLLSAAPTITVLPNVSVNDKQTAIPFAGAIVLQTGSSNVVRVLLDFSPTNVGSLNLPLTNAVGGGYSYSLTVTNASDAILLLNSLVFTPVANVIPISSSSNVTFHVHVVDSTSASSSIQTATLNLTPVNDALNFTVSGVANISDKSAGTTPFQNAVLSDPDNGGLQPQTLSVTMNETNSGYLVASGGFDSNNFVYTFTGTPAQSQTALRGLVFVPAQNVVPVGQTVTNTFKVVDTDGTASVTNNAVKVSSLSANDVPQLTGLPSAHVGIKTGQSGLPFSQVLFSDPDQNLIFSNKNGEDLTWSVTLNGTNTVGGLLLNGVNVATSYFGSGDPEISSAGLQSLSYQAPTLAITGTNAMTFTITAADGHGGTVSSNVFLDVFSIFSPPGLTGTQSGQIVNDNTTIALFSKVGIQSFNGNSITVLLALSGVTNDAQGQLINLGSFIRTTILNAPSQYAFTGTSEAATAAIHALLFQPTPNRINGSSNETAIFGIRLIDGNLTNSLDTTTTVIVVPVNDAPAIAGISPLLLINDSQTVPPFSGVLITDADESGQQPVTAVVSLDDPAKGTFSPASLVASGFALNTNNNTCSFSGVPTNLTAAIRQLVFVPTRDGCPTASLKSQRWPSI